MTRKALQEIKGLQADHDYMKNALKGFFNYCGRGIGKRD